MSVTCTQEALALNIESLRSPCWPLRLRGDRTRPRVPGGGRDRRALGRAPARIRPHNIVLMLPREGLPGRGLYRVELVDVCSLGAAGCPSDPLGDPSALF